MTNNIQIEDVLTRAELLTAKSVADLVIKPENSIETVESNEKAELSNEIVWTPIPETEGEKGRATSYSTKYNDKFYWISENADGGYDIETDLRTSQRPYRNSLQRFWEKAPLRWATQLPSPVTEAFTKRHIMQTARTQTRTNTILK